MQASIWRVKGFSFFPHKERYGSSTRELLLINSSHDNKLFLTRVVLVSGPLRSKIFSSWQRSSKGSILDVELWKLNSKWRIRPNMIRTLRERRTSFAQSKSRHKLYFDKGRPGFRFPTLKNIYTWWHWRTHPKLNPFWNKLFMHNGILLKRLLFI